MERWYNMDDREHDKRQSDIGKHFANALRNESVRLFEEGKISHPTSHLQLFTWMATGLIQCIIVFYNLSLNNESERWWDLDDKGV